MALRHNEEHPYLLEEKATSLFEVLLHVKPKFHLFPLSELDTKKVGLKYKKCFLINMRLHQCV